MNSLLRVLLAGLVIAGAARAASAQAPLPATVAIDDVLRLLNDRSPRTAADRASIDVTAAERITARTYPNPDISYGAVHLVSGLSTGAITQHQVVFDEPLLLFRQRQARLDAADLNVGAERARVERTLGERRLQVRQAFAALLSRQQQLIVIQESVADLQRVQGVVRGRAEAGEKDAKQAIHLLFRPPAPGGRSGCRQRGARTA